jgi:hypothetical protein
MKHSLPMIKDQPSSGSGDIAMFSARSLEALAAFDGESCSPAGE